MKIALTKILFLVLIMSMGILFTGCNKNNKTADQNNNEQNNNNSISPVSDQNDETDLAIGEDTEDLSSDSDQPEKEENSEIATIEKYYSFLSNNNLEDAYQMRSDQAVTSYEKFKGWYENAQYLEPSDFNKTNSGSYQFYVDYKDRNSVATKFKVEMLVIEDKIKTLSSVEVVEGEEKSEEDISDWLTYFNAEAKFKISYPKTYAVTEYKDNLGIISFNFKDTNSASYHGSEIYIRIGDNAATIDSVLAEIKKECDEYGLCADISENKIVDLSNVKGARKITRSTAIGGYMTSYLFTREDWNLNFELSLNWEDEIREKIIDSFEFF